MQKGEKKFPNRVEIKMDATQFKKLDTLSKKQGLRDLLISAG